MDSAFVACCAGELRSVACTVKLKTPAAVGVPETCPLAIFSRIPAGKAPSVTPHVTGGVPPFVARLLLYASMTSPAGSELVVTVSAGALIVMLSALLLVSGGL